MISEHTVTQKFAEARGGGEPEAVVRAPGRVNLLGQHIDHQGGFTNPIAIDRAIVLAAGRLKEPILRCVDVERAYPPFELDLREPLRAVAGKSWKEILSLGLVNSLPGIRESWARYIVGALLYLVGRRIWTDREGGLAVCVGGDIPPAAGLSSSSALVVASLLALLELAERRMDPETLVPLAGEAEHFVGTRGGSGDHAAILLSVEGSVSHFGFHPFGLLHQVALPPDWRVLVCHSGHGAEKSTGARLQFNHRVMAYHLGRLWMQTLLPEPERERIATLRDFLPADARALSAVYKRLRKIPEEALADDIRKVLGDGVADPYLAEINPDEALDLRGVCLFGLAEMVRAREFIQYLDHGDMRRVAKIMAISHDGDRVVIHNGNGMDRRRFWNDYSDGRMAQLAHRAMFDWGNPESEAQLWRQPGRYHSSTMRLDYLVDLVRLVSPRSGAHLSGAGLGGAIAVLCPADDVDRIVETLEQHYYRPEKLDTMAYVFTPSNGARVLMSRASDLNAQESA